MDTFISFVRYFLGALKRLAQAVIVVMLLLVLFRVLESQQNPSIAAFTNGLAAFVAWVGYVLYALMCLLLNPWYALIMLLIAWPLYHYAHTYNDDVGSKVGALKVAAFDLVRMMETTTDGNDAKATKLNDIVYKFAVDGPSQIAEAFSGPATTGSKPVIGDGSVKPGGGASSYSACAQAVIPADLTDTAYKLMERRLADMGAFGGSCGALRSGLMVFLLLMEHGSVSGAFTHMIEHMKKQAADDKKGLPNFVDLKRFFGLPTTWPEKGEPEKLYAEGLSWYQYLVFEAALSDKNKEKILEVMKFYPQTTPDGKKPLTYSGANVLKTMRIYLYNWKIYEEKLADPAE